MKTILQLILAVMVAMFGLYGCSSDTTATKKEEDTFRNPPKGPPPGVMDNIPHGPPPGVTNSGGAGAPASPPATTG